MKNSIRLCGYFVVLFIVSCFGIYGQSIQSIYEVPVSYRSVIVVSPETCPIGIENPKVLYFGNNSFKTVYSMNNKSNKEITKVEVKEVNWQGYQEYTHNFTLKNGTSFLPREILSNFETNNQLPILNLDSKVIKELENEIEIVVSPKKVWIVMVTKVEYKDGTIYENYKSFERLQQFIEKFEIRKGLTPKEFEEKVSELKCFVTELSIKN